MRQRNRLVLGLLLGIVIIAGVMYAAGGLRGDGPESPTRSGGSDAPPPPIQAIGTEVVHSQAGVRQWRLRVGVLREVEKRIELEGVDEGIIYRDGEEALHFAADRGVYDEATGDLELMGNVRVSRGGEPLLVTERLYWDAETKRITTGPVELWYEGTHIRAGGLDGDLSEGTLWLTENVQLVSRDGSVLQASQSVEYHLEEGLRGASGRIHTSLPDKTDE